jgi:hypothetical protein
MEFRGPVATDFENVRALNRAFLALLRQDAPARRCLKELPASLAGRLCALSDGQVESLASAPFLLFSFRERDDEFWRSQLSKRAAGDLFAVAEQPSDGVGRLIAAGLSFVWQLAKQNTYAARLICGASLHWCEELTERTLFDVLATAGRSPDVLTLRSGSDAELWSKLVAGGVSRELLVRQATHISALHALLTRACLPLRRKWAAAACASRAPSLKVAERPEG